MSVLKKMPMMSELAPARDALERRASYAAIWLKKPQSRRPLGFVVAALVALVLLGTTFSHTVSRAGLERIHSDTAINSLTTGRIQCLHNQVIRS